MSTLLFVFLIWFPLASVLHTLMGGMQDIKAPAKQVIFGFATFPALALFELNKLAVKVVGMVPFFTKVKNWFLAK